MGYNQRNLTFLALRGELIGITIVTDSGSFKVTELVDYDTLTQNFQLRVVDLSNGTGETIRDFSDKYRYDVEQSTQREYPNDTRLKPVKNDKFRK